MRISGSDFWCWDGTIDRLPYFLLGTFLFLIKHQIDRIVAMAVFEREWTPWNYFIPGTSGSVSSIPSNDKVFFAVLIAIAVPFIYSGVALTLRRLRSAGLTSGLIVLFFIPVINLIFFIILSLLPPAPQLDAEKLPQIAPKQAPQASMLPPYVPILPERPDNTLNMGFLVPESKLGSAILGVLFTAVFGILGTVLSVEALGNYGWGLFIGLPFCLGLTSVLIYGYHERRSAAQCLLVSILAILVPGVVLFLFAVEGIICLLMALPIALPLTILGGMVGYAMQSHYHSAKRSTRMLGSVFIALPVFMGAEHVTAPQSPLLCVKSSVVVDAPPEIVWRHVVSFTRLPEPGELLFRFGIAYPIEAKIAGIGPGAVRRCEFSTGAFVEPIQVWDEPRLLKFSVVSNPAPMQEWTIYKNVEPPHLHGFLVSNGGQFLLTALPGGQTNLEGTTWYRHNMWPVGYWQLWSDYIIHHIHLRVLNHVKALAESSKNGDAR